MPANYPRTENNKFMRGMAGVIETNETRLEMIAKSIGLGGSYRCKTQAGANSLASALNRALLKYGDLLAEPGQSGYYIAVENSYGWKVVYHVERVKEEYEGFVIEQGGIATDGFDESTSSIDRLIDTTAGDFGEEAKQLYHSRPNLNWDSETLAGFCHMKRMEAENSVYLKISNDDYTAETTLRLFSDGKITGAFRELKERYKLRDANSINMITFVIGQQDEWGEYIPPWKNDGKGIIRIQLKSYGKDADSSLVSDVVLPHEMAHAKIVEEYGDYVGSLDTRDKLVISRFNEIMTDRLAMSTVPEPRKYIAGANVIDRSDFLTNDGIDSHAKSYQYRTLFLEKAKAILFRNTRVIKQVNHVLPRGLRYDFDDRNPNSLMNEFLERARFTGAPRQQFVEGLRATFNKVGSIREF